VDSPDIQIQVWPGRRARARAWLLRALRLAWRIVHRIWRIVRRVARAASFAFGLLLITVVLVGGVLYLQERQALDSIQSLKDPEAAPLPQPVTVYSSDGVKLGTAIVQDRVILGPKEIPAIMGDAAVSIEDQRFWKEPGVDLIGIARAAVDDLRSGAPSQGASTITMQYVNNVYLSHQKTFLRKLREAILAFQLAQVWTKQRILDAYLNTVYFGEGAYGIGAAAKYYFNEQASELTIGQAALLAGMIQDPTGYDPHYDGALALARRNTVLDEMFYQGYITRAQVIHALATPIRLSPIPPTLHPAYPLLFDYALQEADSDLPSQQVADGGYNVITTFNVGLIRHAEAVFAKEYAGAAKPPALTLTQVSPQTGAITTMAQTHYNQYFNLASQAERQPGSTVKAFTLATYLEEGGSLDGPVDNGPIEIEISPGDHTTLNPDYAGIGNVLQAITFSQDPAYYRLYQQVGPAKVLALEERLGLTNMDDGPAAAIGGVRYGVSTLEMAGAYAAFANGGTYHKPYSVAKVVDDLGNVLYKHTTSGTRALPEEVARRVNAALQNVVHNGFPELVSNLSAVTAKYPLAGKTGTTDSNADAWFVGYTPDYAAAVWTGYPQGRIPMTAFGEAEAQGSGIPAQTFAAYTSTALPALGIPPAAFPRPRGLVEVPSVSGDSLTVAETTLSGYGDAYTTLATQDLRVAPNTVLSIAPAAGSWVAKGKPVQIRYATNEREVPQVTGQGYLQALRALGPFTTVETAFQVDASEPVGTVVSQSPAPGTVEPITSAVTLTLAIRQAPPKIVVKDVPYVPPTSVLAGLRNQVASLEGQISTLEGQATQAKGKIEVPDVAGLTTAQASAVLGSLGLTLADSTAGTVVSQSPGPGTGAKTGSVVSVTATP
jgi:penicillin-binding protein 1A